jgi:hypothetical protein
MGVMLAFHVVMMVVMKPRLIFSQMGLPNQLDWWQNRVSLPLTEGMFRYESTKPQCLAGKATRGDRANWDMRAGRAAEFEVRKIRSRCR